MVFPPTNSNDALESPPDFGGMKNEEQSKIAPPPSPLTELQQQTLTNQEQGVDVHTPLREHHDVIHLTHSPTLKRRSISSTEGQPFQTFEPVVDWEIGELEEKRLVSSSSSSSSSASVSSSSSSQEISFRAMTNIKKEINNTLHNHNIQTKIEIAALKAYRTGNSKLSQQDQELLHIYIGKLERISQFEESVSQTLKTVEDEGRGIEATIDVYDHFWGPESGAYTEYTLIIKEIVDLSPAMSALLQDNNKLPGIHTTFGRFVTSIDRRDSPIRKLKEQLIQEKLRIDSTITEPRDKVGGVMYMQWLTRVPALLGQMTSSLEKAGGNPNQLQKTWDSAHAKVALVNTMRQGEELVRDQGRLLSLLSELPQTIPQTINKAREEINKTRSEILFIRDKLTPVRACEENPEDFPDIDERITSRSLERKIDTLTFWIAYITNTIEPQIRNQEVLINHQDELVRLQGMYWPQRNKLTRVQLDDAINEISQNLERVREWETEILVNLLVNRNLSSAVLEAQLIDFKRLQMLNIQQFNADDVAELTPNDRQKYLMLIEEAIGNISKFQAIRGRRQISRTQLRRVRDLITG